MLNLQECLDELSFLEQLFLRIDQVSVQMVQGYVGVRKQLSK